MPQKSKNKVSLILVSKNEEKNVKRFFNSLKKQSRKPDEIVLIDSSKDRTAEISKPFVDKLIKTPTNCAGHARSIGIKHSKGDIIVFTDIDVVPYPNWLEEITKCFENPDINVVQGQVFMKSYSGKNDKWLFSTGLREWGNRLCHCNTAYRRKVLEEIPFDPEQFWDDVEMSYRVSKKYKIYGCKAAKIYHYGAVVKSRTGNKSLKEFWDHMVFYSVGWIRILKKYKGSEKIYWFLRMGFNVFGILREGTTGLKVFSYYILTLPYAWYLETFKKGTRYYSKTEKIQKIVRKEK